MARERDEIKNVNQVLEASLKDEVNILTAEVDTAESQVNFESNKLDLQEHFNSLKRELSDVNEQTKLKSEIQMLVDKKSALSCEGKRLQDFLEKLKAEKFNLESELFQTKQDFQNAEVNFSNGEQTLQKEVQNNATEMNNVKKLGDEDKNTAALKEMKALMENLQKQSMDDQIEFEREKSVYVEKVQSLEMNIIEGQKSLEETEEQCRADFNMYEIKYNEVEKLFSEQKQAVGHLTEELFNTQRELKCQVNLHEGEMRTLQEDYLKIKSQFITTDANLNAAEARVKQLCHECDHACKREDNIEFLESTPDKRKEDFKMAQQQVKEVKENTLLKVKEAGNGDAELALEDAQSKNAQLEEQCNTLRKKYEGSKELYRKLHERCQKLKVVAQKANCKEEHKCQELDVEVCALRQHEKPMHKKLTQLNAEGVGDIPTIKISQYSQDEASDEGKMHLLRAPRTSLPRKTICMTNCKKSVERPERRRSRFFTRADVPRALLSSQDAPV